MDEFIQASLLEREKMIEFLPTFTQNKIDFKYQFSDSTSYDNHDIKIIFTQNNEVKQCVGEIKVRYKHYNGWYLEKQKLDKLQQKYPDKILLYFCITVSGIYMYNLNKIDFTQVKLSKELLPLTSAKKSRLVKKLVYTLPCNKPYCKYYDLFLV